MALVGILNIRIGTTTAGDERRTLVANPFPRCNLTASIRAGRYFAMAAETSGRIRWQLVRRGILAPRVKIVATTNRGAELAQLDATIQLKKKLRWPRGRPRADRRGPHDRGEVTAGRRAR